MQTPVDRPLAFWSPRCKDQLLLTRFEGETALSEPFCFTLDLQASRSASVSFEDVLGQPARVRVRLPGGGERYFHGVINRLAQVKADAAVVHYEADLVSPLALLGLTRRSRAFIDLSTPEILAEVLAHPLLRCEFKWIQESICYFPRAYCVQYEESDLAFAQRLMEEEGIFYFFKHDEADCRLVVTDSSHLLCKSSSPEALVFDASPAAPPPRIRSWMKEQKLCAAKVGLSDFSYQTTAWTDRRERRITPEVQVGTVTHRLDLSPGSLVHEYPGGHAQRFDNVDRHGNVETRELPIDFEGDRLAWLRAEAETVPALRIQGSSDSGHLEPGHLFTLATAHGSDRDGSYYPTRVRHRAHAPEARSSETESYEYANEFEALPQAMSYRPPRKTPKPRIDGVQTALVLGLDAEATKRPDGPEKVEAGVVRVDALGRVKILLPWDRRDSRTDAPSCWVRVSQVWAGNQYGAFFWPRPGHEVVVAFENGDPDRPIIVGSVYNARNKPPYHDEPRGRISGFKSASLGRNPGIEFNSLVFHDAPGNEHVQLRSYRQSVSTRAVRWEYTSGPALEVVGGIPLPAGSGSGGGLFDLLPLFGSLSPGLEQFLNVFPGKSSQVWGDNRSSTLYGKRMTRCLGNSDNRLSVDLQQMGIETIEKIPYLGALTRWFVGPWGGLRGANDMYFGARANQIYWGPAVDIKRCQTFTFKDASFFRKGVPSATTALAKSAVVLTVLTSLAIEVLERLFANRDESALALTLGGMAPEIFHQISLDLEKSLATLQMADAEGYEAKTILTEFHDLTSTLKQVALKASVPVVNLGVVSARRALSLLMPDPAGLMKGIEF